MRIHAALVASIITLAAGPVAAATITEGFTFAVASASGETSVGTHFHSNTGGAFGNPAGKAEVGSFFEEEVRGLSEYNLAGLAAAPSAFVTFNVFSDAGLFEGDNDFPYFGPIDIVAYEGNNTEDISDYEAPSVGAVGNFDTTGLSIGQILSFEITSIFNEAVMNGDELLGIRLQISGAPNGGAFTFDNFRLTTTDDTSSTVIPLPAAAPLMLIALFAFGLVRRRSGG